MLVKIKQRIILQKKKKKKGLTHDQNFCKIRRRDKNDFSKVCLSSESAIEIKKAGAAEKG